MGTGKYTYISVLLILALSSISLPGCINKDSTGKVSIKYIDDKQLTPEAGIISGTIRNQAGSPLSEARVTLEGKHWNSATTGNFGAFAFSDLQPGMYSVTAWRWDVKPITVDVEVKSGKATNLMFFLSDREEEE